MYYKWALQDINNHLNDIDKLMKLLEACRWKKPPDLTPAQMEKIEQIKAQIKAHIAMIRVRLREIQTSADRINGLMNYFLENYVKPVTSNTQGNKEKAQKLVDKVKALAAKCSKFQADVNKAIQNFENWLQFLESVLDEWNKYAACVKMVPPRKDTIRIAAGKDSLKKFPSPPIKEAEELKKTGEKGLNYSFTGGSDGMPGNFYIGAGSRKFSISAGGNFSSLSMKELNNYFDYINLTWNGNLQHIRSGTGFDVGVNYMITRNLNLGVEWDNISSSTEGKHSLTDLYTSKNSTNGLLGNIALKTNPVAGFLRLTAGLSTGPYFSSYTETENDFVTSGKSTDFGFKAFAGTEVNISPLLGLQLTGGYRKLKPDSYGATFFLPAKPGVSLDYSGFFGELKGVIRF
jgi:DNA-binding transcriptional MerR regulator